MIQIKSINFINKAFSKKIKNEMSGLKLNDFKTLRFSANYKEVVKKWIKSYVPNICSLIKLRLRRTLVLHNTYSTYLISQQHPDFVGGAFGNSIQLFFLAKAQSFRRDAKMTLRLGFNS